MHGYGGDGDHDHISKGRPLQICPVPFSPLLLIDKSFSYNKIQQEPLRLTVLKLDGTSFEIYVAKNGTVADLKDAVETAFCYSPQTVSWSHVWGNFCLCYDGYKLLSDNDYISGYEIQDGDQIKFVRHVSDVNRIRKTRSERDVRDLEALNLFPSTSTCPINIDMSQYAAYPYGNREVFFRCDPRMKCKHYLPLDNR